MTLNRSVGHSLSEYAILLIGVLLISLLGMKLLGKDISNLFSQSSQTLSSSSLKDYLRLDFKSNTSQIPSPVSAPSIELGLPLNGSTNVTSVEGDTTKFFATSQDAQKLDALSPTITDPSLTAWYQQIAEYTHFLSGAEGDRIGIANFQVQSVASGIYGDGSSLRDIYNYQTTLKDLIAHPPLGGNTNQIGSIKALASDAIQNSTPFVSGITKYLKNDGSLDLHALQNSSIGKGMTDTTYDKVYSYADMKQKVNSVIVNNDATQNANLHSTVQDSFQLQQKP